jgi:hypothetical protein
MCNVILSLSKKREIFLLFADKGEEMSRRRKLPAEARAAAGVMSRPDRERVEGTPGAYWPRYPR